MLYTQGGALGWSTRQRQLLDTTSGVVRNVRQRLLPASTATFSLSAQRSVEGRRQAAGEISHSDVDVDDGGSAVSRGRCDNPSTASTRPDGPPQVARLQPSNITSGRLRLAFRWRLRRWNFRTATIDICHRCDVIHATLRRWTGDVGALRMRQHSARPRDRMRMLPPSAALGFLDISHHRRQRRDVTDVLSRTGRLPVCGESATRNFGRQLWAEDGDNAHVALRSWRHPASVDFRRAWLILPSWRHFRINCSRISCCKQRNILIFVVKTKKRLCVCFRLPTSLYFCLSHTFWMFFMQTN